MGLKVAPALKGTPRAGLDGHDCRVKNEVTLANPFFVDVGSHADEALATQNLPADHPIE